MSNKVRKYEKNFLLHEYLHIHQFFQDNKVIVFDSLANKKVLSRYVPTYYSWP